MESTAGWDDNPQRTAWNGGAGMAWVAEQDSLDLLFRPFEDLLVEGCTSCEAGQVLDVGCGTGSTTLAIAQALKAQALEPSGRCTGIDLSQPMIARALERKRELALPADFVCADAQAHDFPAGSFDRIVSRFGVMFFQDPIQAFARLRTSARKAAVLDCIAWRSPAENAFMSTAERAVMEAGLLPELAPRQPGGPGQFAFAERARLQTVLADSGWERPDIEPLDILCRMPAERLPGYFSRMGPVGQALQAMSPGARQPVLDVLEKAFSAYVQDGEVRFMAACWRISAQAGPAT